MCMAFHCRTFLFRADQNLLFRVAGIRVLMPFILRNGADQIAVAVITAGVVFMKNEIRVGADQFIRLMAFRILGIAALRMNMNVLKIGIHIPEDQL